MLFHHKLKWPGKWGRRFKNLGNTEQCFDTSRGNFMLSYYLLLFCGFPCQWEEKLWLELDKFNKIEGNHTLCPFDKFLNYLCYGIESKWCLFSSNLQSSGRGRSYLTSTGGYTLFVLSFCSCRCPWMALSSACAAGRWGALELSPEGSRGPAGRAACIEKRAAPLVTRSSSLFSVPSSRPPSLL